MPIVKLIEVQSKQIHALGFDPETSTLAVRFKNWKGEVTSLYHYTAPQEQFDALMSAESKGGYFNKNIKPFPDKYPFTKIESAPAPSAE